VSTTTPRAGTPSTISPPANCRSTIPCIHEHYQSLKHLRSLESRATLNSVYTTSHSIVYSTFDHLCVDYLLVSTTSRPVDYSLYQHSLEIQFAMQNIFKELVMDHRYLGDIGRRTVMRFGTLDAKRPAVAILVMHPLSPDSSWRVIGSSIVNRILRSFDTAT